METKQNCCGNQSIAKCKEMLCHMEGYVKSSGFSKFVKVWMNNHQNQNQENQENPVQNVCPLYVTMQTLVKLGEF